MSPSLDPRHGVASTSTLALSTVPSAPSPVCDAVTTYVRPWKAPGARLFVVDLAVLRRARAGRNLFRLHLADDGSVRLSRRTRITTAVVFVPRVMLAFPRMPTVCPAWFVRAGHRGYDAFGLVTSGTSVSLYELNLR